MSYEIVARPHQQNFIDWAKDKPEVLVLSADLTNSCEVAKWRDTYPDRFFSMGMAEHVGLCSRVGARRFPALATYFFGISISQATRSITDVGCVPISES